MIAPVAAPVRVAIVRMTLAALLTALSNTASAATPPVRNAAEEAGYKLGYLMATLCPLIRLLAIAAVGLVMFLRERRIDRDNDRRRNGRSGW